MRQIEKRLLKRKNIKFEPARTTTYINLNYGPLNQYSSRKATVISEDTFKLLGGKRDCWSKRDYVVIQSSPSLLWKSHWQINSVCLQLYIYIYIYTYVIKGLKTNMDLLAITALNTVTTVDTIKRSLQKFRRK